jgi:hypothetical protein
MGEGSSYPSLGSSCGAPPPTHQGFLYAQFACKNRFIHPGFDEGVKSWSRHKAEGIRR